MCIYTYTFIIILLYLHTFASTRVYSHEILYMCEKRQCTRVGTRRKSKVRMSRISIAGVDDDDDI